MKRLFCLLSFLVLPLSTYAQALPGYIMVERIGGTGSYGAGASALSNSATALFLDQFNPTTVSQTLPVQTLSLPTAGAGSQLIVTDSGTTTTAGYFTRFSNGQGYTVSGYNAILSTAAVASSAPGTINRSIAVITPNGSSFNLDSSSGFNDGGATPTFRSVASVDGATFYAGTSSGIRFQNTPGTVSATTSIVTNNLRTVRMQDSSLFFNTTNGIFLAGTTGTPPTASVTPTQLPAALVASGTGAPLSNSFYFFNNPLNNNTWSTTNYNTLYVADERTAANGGGILRWIFDGTNWVFTGATAYTANGNGGGLRGLTASIDLSTPSSPVVNLWATSLQTNANNLVFLSDTLTAGGGTFGAFSTLATSPTNTVFRGVELGLVAAVPEPATVALLVGVSVLGASTLLYRRRQLHLQRESNLR
jgi:hypothetical protein